MDTRKKIYYFDYFVSKIIFKCYNDNESSLKIIVRNNIEHCGLNKLKLLKLLFFVSAIKVDERYLLDDVFDNFYAMPYGPVESDIYDSLSEVPNYTIEKNRIALKTDAVLDYPNDDPICNRIEKCIDEVYNINPDLFLMATFDLVELSHKAESWKIVFTEAQRVGRCSLHMPNDVIKETAVYFK